MLYSKAETLKFYEANFEALLSTFSVGLFSPIVLVGVLTFSGIDSRQRHCSFLILSWNFCTIFILWSASVGLNIPITARFHHCAPKENTDNNYIQ